MYLFDYLNPQIVQDAAAAGGVRLFRAARTAGRVRSEIGHFSVGDRTDQQIGQLIAGADRLVFRAGLFVQVDTLSALLVACGRVLNCRRLTVELVTLLRGSRLTVELVILLRGRLAVVSLR